MAKRKRNYKNKKLSPVIRVGEMATPERRKQLGGVMTEVVASELPGEPPSKRQRTRVENVLDIMFRYRVNPLSIPQHTAGLKFYELFNHDKNVPRFKVLCNPFKIEYRPDDAEWKALAHVHSARYLVEAYKQLTEEEQAVVRKVCGYDEFPEGKREHRLLRLALDKLALFWGHA